MKRIAAILCSLLLMLAPLTASGKPVEGYNVSYFDMSNGMPNNFVDDIFQDDCGFIWISTHGGGLLRYDGYTFLNFGFGDRLGIWMRSSSCRNVAEDKLKRLWIAFDEGVQAIDLPKGRIVEIHAAKASMQKRLDAILNEPCQKVYCDSKGCLWILKVGTLDRLAFDADGNVTSILSTRHNTKVSELAIVDLDHDGSVYTGLNFRLNRVSVKGGKLVVQDLSTRYPQLVGSVIESIVPWQGRLWFATSRGLYNSDPGNTGWHFDGTSQGLQNESVTSLAVAPEGRQLLIGTLSGIDFMDTAGNITNHWNVNSMPQKLSSNFVNNILVCGNSVWVGTESGGICRVTPRLLKLENFSFDPTVDGSISPGPVNAMYSAPNGDLFVGTVEGGLNIKPATSDRFQHLTTANSGLTHNSVSSIVSDNNGGMWLGTWGGGVCYLSKGKITPVTTDSRHAADIQFVGALAYDPYNNGLWIGANAGLFYYDFTTHRVLDPFPSCRSINGAIGSIVTRGGKLLMGCVPGMVSVDLKKGRDKHGNFTYRRYIYKLDYPDTKAFDKITTFCQSHDGTLWIGSNGYGMYRVTGSLSDTTSITNFTTSDGLANNSVRGIVEGQDGMLWIATENGLSRFNPMTQAFSSFTTSDGILSSQFYFNGAARGRDVVYLGSDKGLTVLYGINRRCITPGTLHFTGLFVNNQWAESSASILGKSMVAAREIRLHEGDRNISIEFSAFSYGAESQGVYYYRLRGYDNEWTKLPPGVHEVSYSSIPSGHYTLDIRYTSSFDGGNEQTASLKVIVTPYFYKSWWFILIVLCILTAITTCLYKMRVRQVRRHEAELLYRPIEAAINESPEPGKLQERIQAILRTQERYRESQEKTLEEDKAISGEQNNDLEPVMDKIMAAMEQQYADTALNVQKLADSVGISRSDLNRVLQTEVGTTTTQFIRDYRLDVARRMLEENVADRNITEVAYRVGFNDPKYFTRCFTQRFGKSPSAYKG